MHVYHSVFVHLKRPRPSCGRKPRSFLSRSYRLAVDSVGGTDSSAGTVWNGKLRSQSEWRGGVFVYLYKSRREFI